MVGVGFLTHERYLDHDTGRGHPERADRLAAVLDGAERAGGPGSLVMLAPRPADRAELALVHPPGYIDALDRFCAAGGGELDPDTRAGPASWDAALLAAGAGPTAIEHLDGGGLDVAFCAVRPPGHHALATRAMGFCLFNNVAVAAAVLAERGERVAVLDWDAHHGNGTQDIFYEDPRVLYVSWHEHPLYPGTGKLHETGAGPAAGTTLNLPLPAGATGDVFLRAFDEVVEPVVAGFAPTWVLVSAGFDAHRRDPLTGLALSAGDFADLTRRSLELAAPGRRLFFLEGGYDLEALRTSVEACLGGLLDEERRPEPPTAGGPGVHVIEAAVARMREGAWAVPGGASRSG